MKSVERRKGIVNLLLSEKKPISGNELSDRYGVSRQIIVRDISILKEQGNDIFSTNSGYIIRSSPFKERVFKVFHTTDQTEDELQTIVDLGGIVADVYVWHKAYGKMEAKLNISSRMQIIQFIESVRTGKSVELMHITGGYHYHTVRAESEEILEQIGEALNAKGYIAPGN
ncbi:MAG: transcription repressor NadR [Ruminococcaceae bacterium]|nr:transcription repressor NadR [Oscillospiraceae bacterium]